MLTTYLRLALLLMAAPICAQDVLDIPDPATVPQPKVILLTGLTTQWAVPTFKAVSFGLERPINIYYHLGIQVNVFVPGFLEDRYYFGGFGSEQFRGTALEAGSFELGLYYKCFFHGRLSGRKSAIYIGPDLRFGVRRYSDDYNASKELVSYRGLTSTFLLRLGSQYRIGKAVIEINLPIGIKSESTNREDTGYTGYYSDLSDRLFVVMPSVSLGYALYDLKTPKKGK